MNNMTATKLVGYSQVYGEILQADTGTQYALTSEGYKEVNKFHDTCIVDYSPSSDESTYWLKHQSTGLFIERVTDRKGRRII